MVPMASQDVQLATNYNRMHMLMEHKELGPAYYALAQACMRDIELLPPASWDSPTATSRVTTPAANSPATVPPAAAGGGGAQQQEPPTHRKLGRFRRR
jgi:hypothetical protein